MSETAKKQRSDGMPVGTPFQPGKSGNPNGRPKGAISLSTRIRNFLENPIDWDLIPVKGTADFAKKYKEKAAADALIHAAFADALSSNSARGSAREWLRKGGYGDKIDVTSGDKPIPVLGGIIVSTNDGPEEDSEAGQAGESGSGRDERGKDDSDTPPTDTDSPNKE